MDTIKSPYLHNETFGLDGLDEENGGSRNLLNSPLLTHDFFVEDDLNESEYFDEDWNEDELEDEMDEIQNLEDEEDFYDEAEFYEEAEADYEQLEYDAYNDESIDYNQFETEEFIDEETYIEEEGDDEDYIVDEGELTHSSSENNEFDHEVEYLFEDFLSSFKKLWKSSRKPSTPDLGTSSNYWISFGNRAACIAQKEWEHWDKGKRHETNPAFQKRLLSYYISTQKSAQGAQRAAESNLKKNSSSRSPWSAAFISYVMKKAGAGEYFHYNSSHLNYMIAAKRNNVHSKQNPFQLFDLKQAKPKLGDLVCNSRGCFDKTYSNIEKAKSTRCGDSKYAATFSHCDMVVEVDEKNNCVWVIGGNTGNNTKLVGGLGTGTVGKKTRKLDRNGYLIKEKGIFALLKVRTDLNVPAPTQGANHTPCSIPESMTTSPVDHGANTVSFKSAADYNNRNYNKWSPYEFDIYRLLGVSDKTPSPEIFVEMLMNWQRKNGLTADGKLGSNTLEKLKARLLLRDTKTSEASFNPSPLGEPNHSSSSGLSIKKWSQIINSDKLKEAIQKIIPKLPKLPPKANVKLDSGIINGLMARERNRYLLLNRIRTGSSWGAPSYGYIIDNKIKANSTRRKLMEFDERKEGFRRSVNLELSGSDGRNTLLDTALGLVAGVIGGPTGLVWTGMTTVLAFSKRDQQPVRVRNGDEIYQIEVIGMNGNNIEHMELILLVDPFRAKAGRGIQQWIISDIRTKIVFPK